MARAFLLLWAEEQRLKKQNIIRNRFLRTFSQPFGLSSQSFIDSYRLTKEQCWSLCQELQPYMAPERRGSKIRPEIRILAAIHFLATGSYQRPVGAHNLLNMSQSVVSRCIEEVVEALNARDVQLGHIHFPANADERQAAARRFYELNSFPGVIGCVDGTHVAIIRPEEHEEAYFNRKHYHSLNVMIICDADMQILHVDASCGGASHDSHVWNLSPVREELAALNEQGTRCWLLGDSGYAQRPYIMTPILGAAEGSPEEHYTTLHCSARNTVERCIGVLKSRWRCLLAHRVLHYDPVKAGKIVNACVVLHNIANAARLPAPQLEPEERRRDLDRQIHIDGNDAEMDGVDTRAYIIRRLWRVRHRQ